MDSSKWPSASRVIPSGAPPPRPVSMMPKGYQPSQASVFAAKGPEAVDKEITKVVGQDAGLQRENPLFADTVDKAMSHAKPQQGRGGTNRFKASVSWPRVKKVIELKQRLLAPKQDRPSIHKFLEKLGMEQYEDAFEAHDIRSARDLPKLTDAHYDALGISIGHRLKISEDVKYDRDKEQAIADRKQNDRNLARARLDLESGDRRSKSIQSVLLVATLLTAASASFLVGEMEAVAWGEFEEDLSWSRVAAVVVHTTCVCMDLYCVMMLGMLDFVLIVAMDPVGAGGTALLKAKNLITAETSDMDAKNRVKEQQDIFTAIDRFSVTELDLLLRSLPGWNKAQRDKIIERQRKITFFSPDEVPSHAEGATLYAEGYPGTYVKEFQFAYCDPDDMLSVTCNACIARKHGIEGAVCKLRYGWLWACRNCGRPYCPLNESDDQDRFCNTEACMGWALGNQLMHALETKKSELEARLAIGRSSKTKVSGIRNELGTYDQREIAAGTRTFEFLANHQIKFHREMAVKITILSIPLMVVGILMSSIANFGNDNLAVVMCTAVTGVVLVAMMVSIYSVMIHGRKKVKKKRIQSEKTWIAERDVSAKKISKASEMRARVDRQRELALQDCVSWCIRTAQSADQARDNGVIARYFGPYQDDDIVHAELERILSESHDFKRAKFEAVAGRSGGRAASRSRTMGMTTTEPRTRTSSASRRAVSVVNRKFSKDENGKEEEGKLSFRPPRASLGYKPTVRKRSLSSNTDDEPNLGIERLDSYAPTIIVDDHDDGIEVGYMVQNPLAQIR